MDSSALQVAAAPCGRTRRRLRPALTPASPLSPCRLSGPERLRRHRGLLEPAAPAMPAARMGLLVPRRLCRSSDRQARVVPLRLVRQPLPARLLIRRYRDRPWDLRVQPVLADRSVRPRQHRLWVLEARVVPGDQEVRQGPAGLRRLADPGSNRSLRAPARRSTSEPSGYASSQCPPDRPDMLCLKVLSLAG